MYWQCLRFIGLALSYIKISGVLQDEEDESKTGMAEDCDEKSDETDKRTL